MTVAGVLDAVPVGDVMDVLGEGPHWDGNTGRLVRVDLYAGLIHSLDPVDLEQHTLDLGGAIGFAVPRATGGFVIGRHHNVELVGPDGDVTVLATVPGELPTSRLNDGKCDAAGRVWTGTLSPIRQRGAGSLYRVDPDGSVRRMLDGVTMSNGLAWSPEGDRLYYVDSTTRRIDALDFDAARGTLGARRTFAAVAPRDGMPDGLTVDGEGGVWVALYGGGRLHRYTPHGHLDEVLRVPVSTCTSAAFGAGGLNVLYITTSRHRLSDLQRSREPLAGRLLCAEPGPSGLPMAHFPS